MSKPNHHRGQLITLENLENGESGTIASKTYLKCISQFINYQKCLWFIKNSVESSCLSPQTCIVSLPPPGGASSSLPVNSNTETILFISGYILLVTALVFYLVCSCISALYLLHSIAILSKLCCTRRFKRPGEFYFETSVWKSLIFWRASMLASAVS